MRNLVPSHTPGTGLLSGTRISGIRWFVLVFLASSLSGCATKGDLRDVRTEIQALVNQQRLALEELSGLVADHAQREELSDLAAEITRRIERARDLSKASVASQAGGAQGY